MDSTIKLVEVDSLLYGNTKGRIIMSKKIAVLVTNMVEEIELTDPVEKFKEAGHTVDLIDQEAGKTITGKNGKTFTIDKGIDDVSADSYDALLVPGGYSPDLLRIDERNAAFARTFIEAKKPVFAICHGPQFLIDTDLLSGVDYNRVYFYSQRPD